MFKRFEGIDWSESKIYHPLNISAPTQRTRCSLKFQHKFEVKCWQQSFYDVVSAGVSGATLLSQKLNYTTRQKIPVDQTRSWVLDCFLHVSLKRLTFAVAVSHWSQKAKSLLINMAELKCCHLSLKTGLWGELPELSRNASPGADNNARDVHRLCSFLIHVCQRRVFSCGSRSATTAEWRLNK